MLTFIEMSNWHPIVSSPISIKYKYKLANHGLLVSINQSLPLFTNFLIELKKQIGIMIWNKI